MNKTMYDDEIDLIEYFKIIWKYKRMIVVVVFIAVFSTFVISKMMPPIFTSTVTFILPQDSAGGSVSSLLSGYGLGNLIGANGNADLIVEVLRSRRMGEDLVCHLDLKNYYGLQSDVKANSALMGAMTVANSKSGLIRLSVDDISPTMAAKIANYFIENLDKINEDVKLTARKPMVQVLDKAIPPTVKSKPSIRINVIIACILAVFFSFFLAFTLEYFLIDKKQKKNTGY